MSNNRKVVLVVFATLILFSVVIALSYAYFTFTANTSNNIAYNVSFNGTYNFTVALNNTSNTGGSIELTAEDLYWRGEDVVVGNYTNKLDIKFVNGSSQKAQCIYDYIWTWDSNRQDYNFYHISSGATKEFTVSSLEIGETQVQDNNDTLSAVVGSGKITANASSTTTKTETIEVRFYNLANVDQRSHSSKKYKGYVTIANAKCGRLLADYLIDTAPKSGTDAVSSSPWILAEDDYGNWRYAGKNPDNYIQLGGELWRIVGVMKNTEYCVGTFSYSECDEKKVGDLVKLVRNASAGAMARDSSNTNNWISSSALQTLINKPYAQDSHVAVVNWSLYGTSSYTSAATGKATVFYKKERNIDSTGALPSGNPSNWYGKVGLLYPSDFEYSTNGNAGSGTYDRAACLNSTPYSWNSDPYTTDCSKNSYITFVNITSTAPSTGTTQWLLSPYSGNTTNSFYFNSNGRVYNGASTNAYNIRPAVYLTPETSFSGTGNGKWNNPYIIS